MCWYPGSKQRLKEVELRRGLDWVRMARTISSYGMGRMMDDFGAVGDAVARKGFHGGAIDVLLRVLHVESIDLS